MSTDNVMHRELPYAESADLTTYRYQPRRYIAVCVFTSQYQELNARVEPCGTYVLTPKD